MSHFTSCPVILVVDDEPFVLNAVCCILSHFGYTVLRAASAEEALHLAANSPQSIDLLLADVIMPRLSGVTLAERFAELHPETQYLFMAGFPEHPEVASGIVSRGRPLLPKPFLPKDLLAKIRQVLNRESLAFAAGT